MFKGEELTLKFGGWQVLSGVGGSYDAGVQWSDLRYSYNDPEFDPLCLNYVQDLDQQWGDDSVIVSPHNPEW
nr:hypothetical protein Iba_chr14bCG5480 [Ipomoea batatas]